MSFLTKAREASNADNPRFGGGGSYLSNNHLCATEVVFGITNIRWDGENVFQGQPRPRWLLDVIPWYEGDTLPGNAEDARGRPVQLDAGIITLASQQTRDALMDSLLADFEAALKDDPEYVDGPAVLVKVKVPGGRGGTYIDLCAWDEENEAPLRAVGEPADDDSEEPRRPSARQAPTRGNARPAAATRTAPAPQAEAEGTPPPRRGRPPAASRGAAPAAPSGFADASGAESGGPEPAPALAGEPITAADLKIVSDVVGAGDYRNVAELAKEYALAEGEPFPGVKSWLSDHGIDDYPKGRGRIKPQYRDAYSIALRCWMEYTGRDAEGNPVEGAEPAPGGPDHTAAYNRQPGRDEQGRPARTVQPAEVPENANEADARTRPAGAPVRPEEKQAWMPPDQAARGPQPASEHVYAVNDVGDSVEPCPGCGATVTHRAFPSGAGSYAIMHECPQDGVTRPLQATNIRKG